MYLFMIQTKIGYYNSSQQCHPERSEGPPNVKEETLTCNPRHFRPVHVSMRCKCQS